MDKLKLSQEERENVVLLAESDGFKTVLKLLGYEARAMEDKVLKYDLINGELQQLAVLKSAAEGSQLLLTRFQRNLQNIKESLR